VFGFLGSRLWKPMLAQLVTAPTGMRVRAVWGEHAYFGKLRPLSSLVLFGRAAGAVFDRSVPQRLLARA
jgi:hypothetical protein